ncbi:MAG: peptidyl-tRNA hydrolase, PTH1 family [Candidatus Peregrinibacteria bacterium Greene0416_62]|nr:MAG: peptidyl-tRNA hydrolase, PTH1 family [Candidatus Peregrinibacteria bacterium Greene0416_62]TSC96983.1 MAG: peptidyl-tRNA hydrolase, PTH1 family [Candidatus Peregrinibacteria bacterium Greene1014_49]
MKPQILLIGLGNPGQSYERTRHNAGFIAIDRLSETFGEGEWKPEQKFSAEIQDGRIITIPILLVKPQTYMNLSGEAVTKLVRFYKIDPATQCIVFSDDVDLPLGTIRFRTKGGPGTHNGMKSIVDSLGEGFPRLRIGIGPQPKDRDLATWVLNKLSAEEARALHEAMDQIPEIVRKFVLGEA